MNDDWIDQAAEAVGELGDYIQMWMAIYQKCLDAGMPDEMAIHFVKQLMGERIPPT